MLLRCVVVLVSMLIWSVMALAQDSSDDATLAVVGRTVVTEADLERAFSSRGRNLSGEPAAARKDLLDLLVAEFWVDQNFANRVADDPLISAALGEARRQVLFEIFAQSEFDATPPDDAEVTAYIVDHPELFADRVIYRFQQVSFEMPFGGGAEDIRDLLQAFVRGPADSSALAEFSVALLSADIALDRNRFWTGGEALAESLRARLQSMSTEGRRIDVVEAEQTIDLVVLFESETEPADPEALRDAIENRILQERYAEHRRSLAQATAAPYLGADPAPVAKATIRAGVLAVVAMLGALTGLALAALIKWPGRTRDYFKLARRNNIDELDMSALQRPAWATALSVLFALGTLGAAGLALVRLPIPLASLEVVALFPGFLLLGLVFGMLLWPGLGATLEICDRRRRASLRRVLILILVISAMTVGLFVVPDQANRLLTSLDAMLEPYVPL